MLNGYKNINTKANILITSTSKHIPLIANDIASVVVDVNDTVDEFCDEMKKLGLVAINKHDIATLIEQDLEKFVAILQRIDISKLVACQYSEFYRKRKIKNEDTYDFAQSIVDGDSQILEVFWLALVNKDATKFDSLNKTNKNVYNTLITDFLEDRILATNLEIYLPAMFGESVYKSNRAILKASREKNVLDKYVKKHTIGDKVYYNILEQYLNK